MTFLNTHAPSGHRRCADLRCKEMYYHVDLKETDGSPLVEQDDDDRHIYWCLKTSKGFGPEGGSVDLERCCPERRCYRS